MKKIITLIFLFLGSLNIHATNAELIKSTALWIIEDKDGKEYVSF